MIERVGACSICQKTIYCENGFLNGVVLENKDVLCFSCHEDQKRND